MDRFSRRWSPLTRGTLYAMMLIVTFGTLGIYSEDALWPRKAQAAFVYVLAPPMSCLLTAVVIAAAAFLSGKRSRAR